MRRSIFCLVLVALALGLPGCEKKDSGSPSQAGPKPSDGGASTGDKKYRIAFVTNQIADFWNIAKAGCADAQKDLGVTVEVRMPQQATAVLQNKVVDDLLASGIDAIAISPIDAVNQKEFLNKVAAKIPLITHDSDAPTTDRLVYIGMDNYEAGRMCGQLVVEAMPEGGEVMLFIGRLEQDNSKYRRQGVIDVLLGRDRTVEYYRANPEFDPVDQPIKGEKFTILGTLLDQGLAETCQRKAADAINAFPDMDAMVGLFEYNPPACYQALKQANKLGSIKLIGFDENDVTLQGIKDGTIVGTVVQNPYMYGYRSVEVLKAILSGDKSVIPASGVEMIPPRKVTKENVDAYWADLKAKKAG